MTGFELYWLLKLTDIGVFLGFVGVFIVVFSSIGALFGFVEMTSGYGSTHEKDGQRIMKLSGKFVLIGLIPLLIAVFMPTTKQMAAIYVLPDIINNERVNEIPDKLLDLLDAGVDIAKDKAKEDDL